MTNQIGGMQYNEGILRSINIVLMGQRDGFDVKLRNKMRYLRLKENLTIKFMAIELGVSSPQYKRYEDGKTRVSAVIIIRLMSIFKVGFHELIGQDDPSEKFIEKLEETDKKIDKYNQETSDKIAQVDKSNQEASRKIDQYNQETSNKIASTDEKIDRVDKNNQESNQETNRKIDSLIELIKSLQEQIAELKKDKS